MAFFNGKYQPQEHWKDAVKGAVKGAMMGGVAMAGKSMAEDIEDMSNKMEKRRQAFMPKASQNPGQPQVMGRKKSFADLMKK